MKNSLEDYLLFRELYEGDEIRVGIVKAREILIESVEVSIYRRVYSSDEINFFPASRYTMRPRLKS